MLTQRILAIFLVLCALPCAACARADADWFAPFRGGYSTELHGSYNGVDFAATLTLDAPNESGVRTAALTFYAPSALAGASLTRTAAGELTLHKGDWSLAAVSAAELSGLLELFPTKGTVRSVALTDSGHTRITGEDFVLELRADGTPASLQTSRAQVTVVSWQAHSSM